MNNAAIALEDGTIFYGKSFGADGIRDGEVVFNTSMTGYQEILTDPSYKGQIVTMTYPQIGNYGTNSFDNESKKPHVSGFIVKDISPIVSNFRSEESLGAFLKRHNIIGIRNIDTRALTRHIRTAGAMKSVISTVDLSPKIMVQKAKDSPGLIGRDLVSEVTTEDTYDFKREPIDLSTVTGERPKAEKDTGLLVVAYDYGMKDNILFNLTSLGIRVKVVKASAPADMVMEFKPDGIFLSNGPGDPEGVPYAINEIKKLIEKKGAKIPIFGICLGHQLLALALGGKTYKLKFGHRGANQPVKNLATSKVEITSQNHGFAVEAESLPKEAEVTHINLNDNTVEGLRHRELPLFSVQYHPEASPGPHDSRYLFSNFLEMMTEHSR
ncbi:MAG: glutamine-hydrolyzing carbamoyl-phosphate synthase small subunit [Deltaproteobacteria bacterium]|uniref:Carbamoyl phosphate synthase small chain n=1 Tax=Candidatus Zymogenus saltonus TaxID=2844893 RepID=A0A9D8PNN6_9DELT|nr:glutamine-hydrolyzing carbamoyl-phosphate synthase small subunit [Candidatus Zymogenus saltonus]